jgi:CBS domain-containing protein
MIVRNLMQKNVVTCSPSTSVHDAAGLMRDNDVGSIVIVEEGGMVKGLVTDRDIALNVAADSKDSRSTPVNEIMTPDPQTVNSNENIETALKIMSRDSIRRLPVVQEGKLVGLLSSSDLAVELKEEFDEFISLEEAIAR